MEENTEMFTYTYSARQQEEVRRILQKYTPPQEDKMELLRRLDKSAQQPGTIAGSNTCLYDCMKRAVLEMNVPLESAVRAASENPARSIGVDNDYGSLAAGRYGNVILADKELNIKAVIQKGTRIV